MNLTAATATWCQRGATLEPFSCCPAKRWVDWHCWRKRTWSMRWFEFFLFCFFYCAAGFPSRELTVEKYLMNAPRTVREEIPPELDEQWHCQRRKKKTVKVSVVTSESAIIAKWKWWCVCDTDAAFTAWMTSSVFWIVQVHINTCVCLKYTFCVLAPSTVLDTRSPPLPITHFVSHHVNFVYSNHIHV